MIVLQTPALRNTFNNSMNCSARFCSLQTLKTSSKMLFWLHVWWYLQHLNNLFLHVVYAGWLPIKEILKLSRNFFMNIINKYNHMIFLVQLGINKHSQNFFKDHNFVGLWKNLLVLIYSKLHEKSCDYLSKKQKNNKGSPARTGSTKRSTDQGSMFCIQLFRERLSEKKCMRQFRKVVWDVINTLFLTL